MQDSSSPFRRKKAFVVVALVAAFITALSVMPDLVSAGNHRSFVTHNCHGVKIRPWQILFACGDGNYYADHLHWKRWRTGRARGHGQVHYNDCHPSCAEGQFHEVDSKLRLRRPRFCENVDKWVFRRARVIYAHPVNGRWRAHFRLFCPI